MYSELQDNPFDKNDDITLSLTGERNGYANYLWKWLLQVVNEHEKLACSNACIMENQLLAEVSARMTVNGNVYCMHVLIRTNLSIEHCIIFHDK